MESKHQIPSSPLLLRDISNNFKTPKPKKPDPNINNSFQFESPCPTFFSALKQTPKSSSCTTVRRNKARFSLAAQKVRAVELEQTKSSRKAQSDKEKALKSLANSLTVWLNFLLENPRSCGVEISRFTGEDSPDGSSKVFLGEKRDSTGHGGVEVDREWRGPKRRKDELWIHKGEVENKFSSTMYSRLKVSLGDICSLDDMKERMATYLSLTTCKEILNVMTHVTKNIDEGRLKMKAHCPIVTDVGMKENAIKILMSYNPVWLRIGLYIVFGGESLLPKPNADTSSEQEASFLKMVAEKLLFSHAALAKAYIYNKLVDGLYRPGYYEKLGSVILKKFLLLALILDRAKSHSSLPISYGIDGLDGGSPLLFTPRASIKSSSEMISGFLSSDVMHGVGNLITHLTIIGYKVSYQQNPLVKYVFKVTDLFNDLKDGVLLCRVIQLLQHDPSILKKVVISSDDRKKNMANCEIALKYLKKSGVPLHDEDGTEIITEDIVNSDKELVIALLWNIFVHLQFPLLINNKLVSDEITNIRGPEAILPNISSQLEMLLEWIKAICDNYDLKVENLASLVDGKAMWCLLDYYFRKELCNDTSNKELQETNEVSIMSASDYVDAVHNFLLSQKLTTLLGNFPEVLQVSDILEYKGACSDQGVIILLVFLSSQLIVKRNLQQINFHKLLGHNQTSERKCVRRERNLENHDEALHVEETCQNCNEDNGKKFKAIMEWWKEMAQNNSKANEKPVYAALQSVPCKQFSDDQRGNAAKIIQSHFRRLVEHRNYTRTKKAVSFLQRAIRTLIAQRQQTDAAILIQTCYRSWILRKRFLNQKQAAVKVQAFYRSWILRKSFLNQKQAAIQIQACYHSWIFRKRFLSQKQAAAKVQACYRSWILRKSFLNQKQAAIQIQAYYHSWILRNNFLTQKQAAVDIQSLYRGWVLRKRFLNEKQAATKIQSHYRGWVLRKRFLNEKQTAIKIQSLYRGWALRKLFLNEKQSAIKIQSHYRGWLSRSCFLKQKQAALQIQAFYHSWIFRKRFLSQKQAAAKVQACYRSWILRKSFLNQKQAAIQIQACYHRWILRNNFLTQKQAAVNIQSLYRGWVLRKRFLNEKQAATKIQSHYRGWVLRKRFLNEKQTAIKIQSLYRGWALRKLFLNEKQSAIKIQSHYRGWLSRSCFLKQKQAVMKLQRFYWSMKCLRNFRRNKLEFNSAMVIQSHTRGWIARRVACRRRCQIVQIQSVFRGWLMRREFLLQKDATTKIQSAFRRFTCLKAFNIHKDAAIVIQRYVRGCITRKRLLVTSCLQEGEISGCNHDALTRTKSAIVIQTNVRRWIAKRKTVQRRHRIAVIQSYWKGYIERKHSREKVSDIRLRVQQAAANVDDGKRIINRLIAALAELKNMKSLSGILHTCATLDMATKHSQKCCEELVAAGAIDTLLKLIGSISRSIAEQEVLRHTFSTFRNLTRHPHLTKALIETHGLSQAILLEFIRNKEETYFIAADVLQNICSHEKGVERLRGLPSLVKRLHNNVENLKKKAANDKRNPRTPATKEQVDRSRRLKEAVNILKLITNT